MGDALELRGLTAWLQGARGQDVAPGGAGAPVSGCLAAGWGSVLSGELHLRAGRDPACPVKLACRLASLSPVVIDGAVTRSRRGEDPAGTRSRRGKDGTVTRSRRGEDGAVTRSRRGEDPAGTRSRRGEDPAGTRSWPAVGRMAL
ncbi:hypothetical protein P7K49_037010 [Saguinus oedipus]|uniref:Uncharacterized protein n=1 Tax=Saguinus oedipus TaxID=9490 RepID=A0ABQ9TMC1_SAGOE|nr:hypothetical protein P7K49_037010 [Saguinus oedipus]